MISAYEVNKLVKSAKNVKLAHQLEAYLIIINTQSLTDTEIRSKHLFRGTKASPRIEIQPAMQINS